MKRLLLLLILFIATALIAQEKRVIPIPASGDVTLPMDELASRHPHAVLGMFDVTARPWVSQDELTLSIPFPKFVSMVAYMDESFLITESWRKVKSRIEGIN